MGVMTSTESEALPAFPPGVTPINDPKQQKRVSKTLSKAVSLHLEGKLESAAKLLNRAIELGERGDGLLAALGHIQYEMHDFAAAASTYSQLTELDPLHRTPHFNLGVCRGNLKEWQPAAESFPNAFETEAPPSDA